MTDPPANYESGAALVSMEDGSIDGACVQSKVQHLLLVQKLKVNSEGVARWMQCRVIELEKLIPAIKSSTSPITCDWLCRGCGCYLCEQQWCWHLHD